MKGRRAARGLGRDWSTIKKLVHISSISALGRHSGHTIDTSHLSGPDVTYSPYGRSKKDSELEVWRGMQEGLTASILNPSLIMGSGDWSQGSPKMIETAYHKDSHRAGLGETYPKVGLCMSGRACIQKEETYRVGTPLDTT